MAAVMTTDVHCRTLIEEGLPDLQISSQGKRTHKASLSGGCQYDGKILDWVDFDREVEEFIYAQSGHNIPDNVNVLFQRPRGNHPALIEAERYLYGEEKGVEGRFNHQVTHVVQNAASLRHLAVKLGDYRATAQHKDDTNPSQPDMACMSSSIPSTNAAIQDITGQDVRFIGECKADWKDKLNANYRAPGHKSLRKWLSNYFKIPAENSLSAYFF